MKNRLLVCLIGLIVLVAILVSLTAFAFRPAQLRARTPVVSVCTMSDSQLNGPGAQENDLYCATVSTSTGTVTTNIAPSTYLAAIALAQTKGIVIGTPTQVSTIHGFSGELRVDVEFSRGFNAEHLLVFKPGNIVAIYAHVPTWQQIWP